MFKERAKKVSVEDKRGRRNEHAVSLLFVFVCVVLWESACEAMV